jgi:hypothetical protein
MVFADVFDSSTVAQPPTNTDVVFRKDFDDGSGPTATPYNGD